MITLRQGKLHILKLFVIFALVFPTLLTLPTQAENGTRVPLDKMVGQLIIAGFYGRKPADSAVIKMHQTLGNGHAGGVIIFDRNIKNSKQLKILTQYLASATPFWPVLIAIDEEGGIVERLGRKKGFHRDPGASYVARTRKPEKAEATYKILADELLDNGINLNLAPVVDLRLNRNNRVIGRTGRAYGNTPQKVIPYASAFIRAHHNAGILTALKHFPGHGSSTKDSHKGLPDITRSWQKIELTPYRVLINNNMADIIMTGHLFKKSWGLPASLSKEAVTGLLKQYLTFQGPVITDDLQMRAISRKYNLIEASILALNAGNDLILVGNVHTTKTDNIERLHAAIIKAVKAGIIPEWRIRNAYNRVKSLKWKLLAQRR